ncbi:Uncharacterised protein [Kingella potus]|uniref:Uncharacterized protein n=1 Tax=Kingella potus TaxID=265175 RepID=A0A377R0K9_9NEIS|nr:hypothetical protein [Kingella potus]UOP00892.1 hypothetical protein LVJ84_00185 [Kingella potus]STR00545.1 Uncharacterised protein [Kingella potus]
MKKLLNMLRNEWHAAFDPKTIVIDDYEDIKIHAGALRCLNEEERETLLEYVTRAEISKQTGRDTGARYGITVGEALEDQHTMQDIESSIASFGI